jgi:predicted DNA repair protein MutK
MLLDDIATILDDVASMSKVAVQKTAGVLGDDLALNAKQVTGVDPKRELPVVLAVAKGSAINKVIIVPAALTISALVPALVHPLLTIGGAYLCFEGVEKLTHKFFHSKEEEEERQQKLIESVADESKDLVVEEKDKIRGAIRTDFILSAEIIVISLATVEKMPFLTRSLVLVVISVIMTIGVYGLVALIVKMDDAGLHLSRKSGTSGWERFQAAIGRGLLWFAPYMLKFLAVAGTLAMFLVGGHILVEGLPYMHDITHKISHSVADVPTVGWLLEHATSMLLDLIIGVTVGAIVLVFYKLGKKLFASKKTSPAH